MQTINISIEAIDNGYILNTYVYGDDLLQPNSIGNNHSRKRYFQDDQSVADAVAAVLAVEL